MVEDHEYMKKPALRRVSLLPVELDDATFGGGSQAKTAADMLQIAFTVENTDLAITKIDNKASVLSLRCIEMIDDRRLCGISIQDPEVIWEIVVRSGKETRERLISFDRVVFAFRGGREYFNGFLTEDNFAKNDGQWDTNEH